MSTDQLHLPALPILVPLGIALMLISWAALRRRDAVTGWRLASVWSASWYAVAVLGATFLPLHLYWGEFSGPPELFRIILVPITTMRPDDFVLNIVMTLPIAVLLRVVAGVRDRRAAVRFGFLLSLAIESAQAVLILTAHGSRWADVNDLIANTTGALLGWLLLRRLLRFERVRAVLAKASVQREREPARPTAPAGA